VKCQLVQKRGLQKLCELSNDFEGEISIVAMPAARSAKSAYRFVIETTKIEIGASDRTARSRDW